MPTTTPKTFVIPAPYKYGGNYLNDAQKTENKSAQITMREKVLEFVRLSLEANASAKKWTVELDDKDGGVWRLSMWISDGTTKVNIWPKMKDGFLLIDNNESRYGVKVSGQFYYDKELTFSKHGKKLYEIVNSMITRRIKDTEIKQKSGDNAGFAKAVCEILVANGQIKMFEADKEGFIFSWDELSIKFQYAAKYSHNVMFTIQYNTATKTFFTNLNTKATEGVAGYSYQWTNEGVEKFDLAFSTMRRYIEDMRIYASVFKDQIENGINVEQV